MTTELYDVLEQLVLAKFEKDKLARLEAINARLNVLRYQTRVMADLNLTRIIPSKGID